MKGMEAPTAAIDPATELFVPRERGTPHADATDRPTMRCEIATILSGSPVALPDGMTAVVRTKRGRGGFGEAWTLEAVPSGQRLIAKFARTFADRERSAAAERTLLREANILSSLSLPGIPPLLGRGIHAGRPFLLLPFVEGETWRAILRRKRRCDDRQWLLRMAELATILSTLHERGIVHGDVKPANIFFGRISPSAKPCTWLIDFGLATSIRDDDANDLYRGCTLGTRGYLDPRTIGNAHRRDAASDVYALGVMLYEGYTWQPLFFAHEWSELIDQLHHDPVALLPTAQNIIREKLLRFEELPLSERRIDLEELLTDILSITSPDHRPTAAEAAERLRVIL